MYSLCLLACPAGFWSIGYYCYPEFPFWKGLSVLAPATNCSSSFGQLSAPSGCVAGCPTNMMLYKLGCYNTCPNGTIVSGSTCLNPVMNADYTNDCGSIGKYYVNESLYDSI